MTNINQNNIITTTNGKKRIANYCYRCCEIKQPEDMQTKGVYKKKVMGVCKECWEKYYKQFTSDPELKRRKKEKQSIQKRKFIIQYFHSNPCVDCGETNILVLQFDHLNPEEKKYEISTILSNNYSLKLLKEEINKCEVVCANCHSKRTAKTFGSWRLDFI